MFRAFDQKYNQHKPNPPVSGDFRRFQSEVLQHLAFEMVRGDKDKPTKAWLTVSRRKAEGILEEWLGKRGVADAPTRAKEWLEDLLKHHLLQVAADPRQIEFHHQLFQEYYAAEALLARVENRHPGVMDDEWLQHFFVRRSAAQALGQIKQDKTHILPTLVALIPTQSGKEALHAISNIQQNCQFYNYEIFRKQLPSVVNTQPSTDNSMLKKLQQPKPIPKSGNAGKIH